MIEREALRDDTAHRQTADVNRPELERSQQSGEVAREHGWAVWTWWLVREPEPAHVPAQYGVMLRELAGDVVPEMQIVAKPVRQDQRRAAALQLVVQGDVPGLDAHSASLIGNRPGECKLTWTSRSSSRPSTRKDSCRLHSPRRARPVCARSSWSMAVAA